MNFFRITAWILSLCILASAETQAKPIATKSGAELKPSMFDQGVEHLQDFESAKALRCFSRAILVSKPSSKNFRAQMFVMIGRALQFDENDIAAAQAFAIANALRPNDQTTVAYLADELQRCGRFDKAAPYLKWLIGQKDKTVFSLETLAIASSRVSDQRKAKSYLDLALSDPANKDNAHLLVMKARVLAKLGLSSRASLQYQQASDASSSKYLKNLYHAASLLISGKKEEQLTSLVAAGEALPNDPIWHSDIGDYYASSGQKKLALDHYNKGMSTNRLCSKAFQHAASFLTEEKRFSDAHNCINYLAKLKPWAGDAHLFRASIYQAQKDYKNAELQLQQALSINPFSEGALTELARCYIKESQLDKARQTLAEAVKKCPNSVYLWRKRGDVEAQNGDYDESARCYQKVIDLTAGDIAQYNVLLQNEVAIAHAKLGARYYRDHELDKALASAKLFNQLKFDPALPAWLTLVHLRPGRLQPGKTEIEKEYVNHILLADMLREGRLDDCIAEYRKAEALKSDDIDLHSYLLNALDEKGDWLESAKEDVVLSSKLVNKVPAEIKRLTEKKAATKPSEAPVEAPTTP